MELAALISQGSLVHAAIFTSLSLLVGVFIRRLLPLCQAKWRERIQLEGSKPVFHALLSRHAQPQRKGTHHAQSPVTSPRQAATQRSVPQHANSTSRRSTATSTGSTAKQHQAVDAHQHKPAAPPEQKPLARPAQQEATASEPSAPSTPAAQLARQDGGSASNERYITSGLGSSSGLEPHLLTHHSLPTIHAPEPVVSNPGTWRAQAISYDSSNHALADLSAATRPAAKPHSTKQQAERVAAPHHAPEQAPVQLASGDEPLARISAPAVLGKHPSSSNSSADNNSISGQSLQDAVSADPVGGSHLVMYPSSPAPVYLAQSRSPAAALSAGSATSQGTSGAEYKSSDRPPKVPSTFKKRAGSLAQLGSSLLASLREVGTHGKLGEGRSSSGNKQVMFSGKHGEKRMSFKGNKVAPTPTFYAMIHPRPSGSSCSSSRVAEPVGPYPAFDSPHSHMGSAAGPHSTCSGHDMDTAHPSSAEALKAMASCPVRHSHPSTNTHQAVAGGRCSDSRMGHVPVPHAGPTAQARAGTCAAGDDATAGVESSMTRARNALHGVAVGGGGPGAAHDVPGPNTPFRQATPHNRQHSRQAVGNAGGVQQDGHPAMAQLTGNLAMAGLNPAAPSWPTAHSMYGVQEQSLRGVDFQVDPSERSQATMSYRTAGSTAGGVAVGITTPHTRSAAGAAPCLGTPFMMQWQPPALYGQAAETDAESVAASVAAGQQAGAAGGKKGHRSMNSGSELELPIPSQINMLDLPYPEMECDMGVSGWQDVGDLGAELLKAASRARAETGTNNRRDAMLVDLAAQHALTALAAAGAWADTSPGSPISLLKHHPGSSVLSTSSVCSPRQPTASSFQNVDRSTADTLFQGSTRQTSTNGQDFKYAGYPNIAELLPVSILGSPSPPPDQGHLQPTLDTLDHREDMPRDYRQDADVASSMPQGDEGLDAGCAWGLPVPPTTGAAAPNLRPNGVPPMMPCMMPMMGVAVPPMAQPAGINPAMAYMAMNPYFRRQHMSTTSPGTAPMPTPMAAAGMPGMMAVPGAGRAMPIMNPTAIANMQRQLMAMGHGMYVMPYPMHMAVPVPAPGMDANSDAAAAAAHQLQMQYYTAAALAAQNNAAFKASHTTSVLTVKHAGSLHPSTNGQVGSGGSGHSPLHTAAGVGPQPFVDSCASSARNSECPSPSVRSRKKGSGKHSRREG